MGFRLPGSKVKGLRFRVQGSWFKVESLEYWLKGTVESNRVWGIGRLV